MSRIEDGNLFFKQFSRVALALSAVTSSFVLANTGVVDGNNSGETIKLTTGENNSSINKGIVAADSNVEINGSISSGIQVGHFGNHDNDADTDDTYLNGYNTIGKAIGLDVNDTATGINITTAGSITAASSTLESYTNGTDTYNPEQNNTEIESIGVNITSAVANAVTNAGSISATAALHNDSNKSEAYAIGVMVDEGVAAGIVNTGSISATVDTHDFAAHYDAEGNYVESTNDLVARVGGRTGTAGELDTKDLAAKARYTTEMLSDAKVGTDSKLVQADTALYNDRLYNDNKDNGDYSHNNHGNDLDTNNKNHDENFIRTDNGEALADSHMHVGTYTPAAVKAPGDLNNTIGAAGIVVGEGATVTGGLTNHNYISSVINEGTIEGQDGNYTNVGLTVTPNSGGLAAADTTGIDENATVPEETNATTPDPVSGGGADGDQGGATYATPSADNGTLDDNNTYRDTALAEAEASIQARYDAVAEPTTVEGKADYDADIAAIDADVNITAVKDDIEKAYQVSPDVDAEIAAQKAAAAEDAPATATAGAAPTDGFKEGTHTARIGHLINEEGMSITGTDGGQGIVVRANSDTNVGDEINASTGRLVENEVTSGTVSAYLGEGVDAAGNSRVIGIDKNSSTNNNGSLKDPLTTAKVAITDVMTNRGENYNRLKNDLIGGLENKGEIVGDAGAAGMTLRADATADANRSEGIKLTDANSSIIIHSNPTSIVAVGTLSNAEGAKIEGGAGAAGLEILSTTTGKVRAEDGNISGEDLTVAPTTITNIREVINHGEIKGGMGGDSINGKALSEGSITTTDVNQTDNLVVKSHADATMGNFFSTGEVKMSLGLDAMRMEADGSSKLNATGITDATVTIDTTSIGGIRKVYGKDGNQSLLTGGNLLNAGEISVALAVHAVDMHAEGLATIADKDGAPLLATIKNSNVTVQNETITGVEGNFVNTVWVDTNATNLEKGTDVKRGLIKAALAADAIHLDSISTATLDPLSIEKSNTTVLNISTSGVGDTFANYGEVSVALSANAVNLSTASTATLGAGDTTTITDGITKVISISNSGTGRDFINGASAIEIGALNETNTSVHNPLADYTDDDVSNPTLIKAHDGYYTVAAMINENNNSDTNSSGARTNMATNLDVNHSTDAFNNQLEQVVVHAYNKEDAITSGVIKAALAADAVKFDAVSTGDLKVKEINGSVALRIDTNDSSIHSVYSGRADVLSASLSDSSIGRDFVNNGEISVALSADGVNGKSTATGTLGDAVANGDVIKSSTVQQLTESRSGVQGDFLNHVVSREVGGPTVFTAQSGAKEIGAFAYARLTNDGDVKITAALAANAVQLESIAANKIDINSNAAEFVADQVGSGRLNGVDARNIGEFKAQAKASRSDINSTTNSVSGVGSNFSNTGEISAALAANAVDAQTIGNTNDLGLATNEIKGSNVYAGMSSVAGVQGDFTNDVHSLKTGDATLIQKDVYGIDEDNVRVSPKYYDNEDAKEGQRVKSNVVDRVVYDREVVEGEIKTALAADAILLDAEGTTNIGADYIGTSNVEVVTNHTEYLVVEGQPNENNATKLEKVGILDSDRIIKVTSQDVEANSVVIAGIGGQFTNRSSKGVHTALAKNALTAKGTATTNLGTADTVIEGGNVKASTLTISGIGHGAKGGTGFLNAAGTYDDGSVEVNQSKVISGRNNESHLVLDQNINDSIDANKTNLSLINSEDVIFWNKKLVVGTMKTALAKDVVNTDATNAGSVITASISAVTGDVNMTSDNEMVAVVGHHVEGQARANVKESSIVYAGIKGDFVNQGSMTSALAGHVLSGHADGTGALGGATTVITGSDVSQDTLTYAGVQGDFRNETLSFDLAGGEVITQLNGDVETPVVVFDKTTTNGQVEMSTALAKTVAELESHAINDVKPLNVQASGGIKYTNTTDWEIGTILSSAKGAIADIAGTTKSYAGITGDFYNTGKIDVALAKDGIDGLADSTNTLGDSGVTEINGSNVNAVSVSMAGIQGDFTNDVVTLDDGTKHIVKRDVLDIDGNVIYNIQDAAGETDRNKSNVILANIDDTIRDDSTRANFKHDGVAQDGVIYSQVIVEGEIGTALSGDAIKLDATGTNNLTPKTAVEGEVRVVRMNDETGRTSHVGIESLGDYNLTVDVTSDTTASTTVIAGIGGRFTNRSSKEIKTSLAKNAITAISTATTKVGDSLSTFQGGTHKADTTVIAGIGNSLDEASNRGFFNLADSYDETLRLDLNHSMVAASNKAGHAILSATANDFVDDNTTAYYMEDNKSLHLIKSAEVATWDNVIKIGKISTALAKDTLNLEGTATGSLTPLAATAVVNDVNVSDEIQSVTGYHVTGSSVGADISKSTLAVSGINGGFLNEGEISTSLAGNVVNTKGTATGKVGETVSAVVGSKLDGFTKVIAGVQNGDFNNTVKSLDTTANQIVTTLTADGIEEPTVLFDRETTDGKVKLEASLSKDVVLLDVTSINEVDPATVDASEYVMSTGTTSADSLAAAKAAKATVIGRTESLGGIGGNFYNTGIIEAKLSLNAITSNATSDNDLSAGAAIVKGSDVTATAASFARITGSFVNDAKLFDTGAPKVIYDIASDENVSNVAGSVIYDQALVKGLIKSGLSKDVLSLIATGNNDINLAEVGNTEVKVVKVSINDLNKDANHTILGEHNISSTIVATNRTDSGIGGILLNAGTMETATGTDVIDLQAVGGPTTVTIAKIGGGTVTADNTVVSGINLSETSTKTFGSLIDANRYTSILPAGYDLSDKKDHIIGFLNDKRDFNTLLETDSTSVTDHPTALTGYQADLVATGTIKADLAQTLVKMHATGGATSEVTSDATLYTTDTDKENKYGTATVTNNNTNLVVVKGDFVNLGEMTTGTAGKILDMVATNEATNTVTTPDLAGVVSSKVTADVRSYVDGDIINTGLMESGTAGDVITMQAIGGTSAMTAEMTDVNRTEWAAEEGIVVASNDVVTVSGANNLFNSGTIKGGAGAKAIVLDASATADSSAVSVTSTAKAKNAIFHNHTTASVTLASLTNLNVIQSDGADTITIHAEGTATRAYGTDVVADENTSTFEDTAARVNASIGNIVNAASTRQNLLWEVDKAFNTDNNDTTDDQLKPLEGKVIANRGEYDLTTGAKIDSNESTYNVSEDLDKLAYSAAVDVNTTAPILSQRVGLIKAATSGNAIDIKATAHDSNSTYVTATTGHILNSGVIDASAAGIGINIAADGEAGDNTKNQGGKAVATVGVIANYVTDDTFKIGDLSVYDGKAAAGEELHAILEGQILGLTAGIKIDAVDAAEEHVATATVDQIVNYRRVLNAGDLVISSAGADADGDEAVADGKVTRSADDNINANANDNTSDANGNVADTSAAAIASRVTDNYGISRLTVDGVYNGIIGDPTLAGSSIIVGENAHVTEGILNYGELKGKVEIGDATLHLYGLVQNADHNVTYGARPETDEMGLTDNYFAQNDDINETSAYVDATDHVQVAGMITTAAETDDKVTDAIVGSKIYFDNSHILKGGMYNADRIILSSHSIINIDDDTEFNTIATNPFDVNLSVGTHNMFTNQGYLNVRAGKKATVTGNYEQKGGVFVTNVVVGSGAVKGESKAYTDGFGQLNVTGNADLTGGIYVMMDDIITDLRPDAGTETRLEDVVVAGSLSSGSDRNITGAGGQGDANAASSLTGTIKVTDNTRVYDFEAVTGTNATDLSLRIVAQDPNAAPINIDTTNVAVSAIKSTANVIRQHQTEVVEVFDQELHLSQNMDITRASGRSNMPSMVSFEFDKDHVLKSETGTAGGSDESSRNERTGSTRLETEEERQERQRQEAEERKKKAYYEIVDRASERPGFLGNENYWMKFFASHGEQDGESTTGNDFGTSGYKTNTFGAVFGVDKVYGEWLVGSAISLAQSKANSSGGLSTDTETTMYQFTEYGGRSYGDGRINVQLGASYLVNDKNRIDEVDFKKYTADYDGYSINAEVEYEQPYKLDAKTTLLPYGRISGTHVENSGYTEEGGTSAQEVSSSNANALVFGIGTRAQYKLSENSALIGKVGVGYDVIAESVEYDARTALNVHSETQHLKSAKPEAFEYELSAGYQFVTPSNTTVRAEVEYNGRDGYDETMGSVKFYFPF